MTFMTFTKTDGSLIAIAIHHILVIEKLGDECSLIRMNSGDEYAVTDDFDTIKDNFGEAGVDFWS